MSTQSYRLKMKKGDVELEATAPTSKEALELLEKLAELVEAVQPFPAPTRETEAPRLSVEPSGKMARLERVSIEDFDRTATGRIRYLIATGFFNSERTLGDTREALAREGFPYDTKPIDKALRLLVRKGELRRVGTRKNYRYLLR